MKGRSIAVLGSFRGAMALAIGGLVLAVAFSLGGQSPRVSAADCGVGAGPACPPNGAAAGVVLELYKRVGNVPGGAYTEIGDIVPIGQTVGHGWLVFIDAGSITDPAATQDRSNWINVFHIIPNVTATTGNQIQLFSRGCNTANHDDVSCFPSVATVLASPNAFLLINQNGAGSDNADVTAFVAFDGNTYNVHSGSPTPKVSKAFGAANVALNGTTTMTITVNNTFPDLPSLSGISFTDTLPAGLTIATPNGLTGTCGGGTISAIAGSGTVSLSGATLAQGASCSFTVNVTGTTSGSKTNSITRIATTQRSTRSASAVAVLNVGAAPTPTPTVPAPLAAPPPAIPQVFQNPGAQAILGGIGNGTRNNTPVPQTAAAPATGAAPSTAAGGIPTLRPPSTGDAGLKPE